MTRAELRRRMSVAEMRLWRIWLKTEAGFASDLADMKPPRESLTFKFLGS